MSDNMESRPTCHVSLPGSRHMNNTENMEPVDRVPSRQVSLMARARSQTSFNVETLTQAIYGDVETVRGRRAAWARVESELGTTDTWKLPSQYAYTSREDLYLDGLQLGKAAWEDGIKHKHGFFDWLTSRYTPVNYSPFGLTSAMFAKTVELMATPEQQQKWLVPAQQGRINGAFVQTELGHGSFVRGLETTATFDASRDMFILDSPTISSTKFWPGSLAFSATHGVVMARLLTLGKDHGVHPFMVQLRDPDTGQPTPSIELGDVGPKPSHNQNDNGYAVFRRMAIPRTNMLMGQAHVDRAGNYSRAATVHPKASYATMMHVRANLAAVCAQQLAAAVTIAVRYSVVREQGVSAYDDGTSSGGGETAVLAYRSQNHRLLTALARAYAIHFTSQHSRVAQADFERRQAHGDFTSTASAHALTAGVKAWATAAASEGAEDARKCCGGAGYLGISGLPEMVYSLTVLCTLEGENHVLWQQTARYLVKWAGVVPPLVKSTEKKLEAAGVGEKAAHIPEDLAYLAASYVDRCPAQGDAFLCPPMQLLVFQHRAQRLLRAAATRLAAGQAQGQSMAEVWNAHMLELIAAAQAHIEYVGLRSFVRAAAAIDDARVRTVLTSLSSLFALATITGGSGLAFVEDGFLSLAQLDAVRGLVGTLLDELLPEVCGLTDAWDFTDAGLGSAIGMRDGDVYSRLLCWTRQLPINVRTAEQGGVHEGWDRFMKPALAPKL